MDSLYNLGPSYGIFGKMIRWGKTDSRLAVDSLYNLGPDYGIFGKMYDGLGPIPGWQWTHGMT